MLLQEYQGIGERHPPAETPLMLVKAVPFISDQLRMVPKMCLTITMFHPMARRDFHSDRNVPESSAENVQPDKEASMNNLQEAQDIHVNYGECHYVETEWGYKI